jgi:limonene-1,2-epoxide hydrolase
MKRVLVIATLALLLQACGSSPVNTVERFVQAHNAGDFEGQLALCTQDVVYTQEGVSECNGTDELRPFLLWDASLNSMMSIQDCTGDGDLVRCLVVETNDWLTLSGVDSVTCVACFQVTRSKIKGIHIVLTGPSAMKKQEKIDEILLWARENFPTDVDFVMPGGTWSYTAETARKWIALTSAWRERMGSAGS